MKSKNTTSYKTAPAALYSWRLFRILLHSTPVSTILSFPGPRRCGRLIGRLLQPYVEPDKINVLAIGRELFFKDTEQLMARESINIIPWRSGHLGRLQRNWVPKICQKQGHFFPEPAYRSHRCWTQGKELIKTIHNTLEQRGKVPLMMSANIDYWQEEVLRQYCTESGTQHLVLCRENISMECYKKLVINRHRQYDFRFHGHVAVFSDSMKEVFIASGACKPEQITVTGAPRMDIWFDERPPVEKNSITLLSFRTNLFAEIFDPVFSAFVKIARKHPELRFAVKCKEGRDDQWARQTGKRADMPENLELVSHTDLRTLLEQSNVIIGVNTLALIEALLTDATVIVPCWGSKKESLDQMLMDPDDNVLQQEISFCPTPEKMEEYIEKGISDRPAVDRECRDTIINRYMHHTPGETASKRVGDLIKALIEGA